MTAPTSRPSTSQTAGSAPAGAPAAPQAAAPRRVTFPRLGRERPQGSNFELYSWYFFRISGLLLVLLVVAHVVIMHLVNTVDDINFKFVADRYASPFWRSFDWLMLMLALLHGLNGARIAIDDYVRPRGWRVFAYSVLWSTAIIFLVIGSIAIITFNPGNFAATAGR